jgi:hypothetical protein
LPDVPSYTAILPSEKSKQEEGAIRFRVKGPSEAHPPLYLHYQGEHLQKAWIKHPETDRLEGLINTQSGPENRFSIIHNGEVLDRSHDARIQKHEFGYLDLANHLVDKRLTLNASLFPKESEFLRCVYFTTAAAMKQYHIFTSLEAFQKHARYSYAIVLGAMSSLVGVGAGLAALWKQDHALTAPIPTLTKNEKVA